MNEGRPRRRHGAPLAALLLGILGPCAAAAPLSPTEARGKALYFKGIGADGKPVKAYIGEESSPVDADSVPCAGCHGEDGRGRPEGGIVPSDITWSFLTKPYGHRHGAYRQHVAFSEKSLAAALAKGIDPGGNRLDPSMPRFALNRADLSALIAYLKRLDAEPVPGVDESSLIVGTILPKDSAVGSDLRALLEAYFDEVNREGGIFSRRIELRVLEVETGAVAARSEVRKFIEGDGVMALLANYAPPLDQAVTQWAEASGVPLITPLSDFPDTAGATGFYLFQGLEPRALALLDQAASDPKPPRLALIAPRHETYKPLLAWLSSQAAARGWPAPLQADYAPGANGAVDMSRAVGIREADTVLFVGSEVELRAWAEAADALAWHPRLWFAGLVTGRGIMDLPPELLERTVVTLPFDPERATTEAFRNLQRRAGVGDRSFYSEAYALAGARMLVQALKQVGRVVSREKLLAALQNLRDVEAGPLPPLSYGPSRRLALTGVAPARIDPATRRLRLLAPIR